MTKEVRGTFLYGLDNDELAGYVGEQLKRRRPDRFQLIEYDGPVDWPGYLSYADEKAAEIPRAVIPALKQLDTDYWEGTVRPHVLGQLRKRRPRGLLLELHSTLIRSEEVLPYLNLMAPSGRLLQAGYRVIERMLSKRLQEHTECRSRWRHYAPAPGRCDERSIGLNAREENYPHRLGKAITIELVHGEPISEMPAGRLNSIRTGVATVGESLTRELMGGPSLKKRRALQGQDA